MKTGLLSTKEYAGACILSNGEEYYAHSKTRDEQRPLATQSICEQEGEDGES